MNDKNVLSEICRDPENDELRLAYAKLIQPTDPDRAEFIRLQLEIAALRRQEIQASNDRRSYPWCPELERRAEELLCNNRLRWTQDLERLVTRRSRIRFDRGFPAQIEIEAHLFAARANTLFQVTPVRHIDLAQPIDAHGYDRRDPLPIEQVLSCAQLSRVDSLGFVRAIFAPSSRTGQGAVAQLARCPHLTRCAYIAFVSTEVTEGDLLDLAAGELTSGMLGISKPDVGEVATIVYGEDGTRSLATTFDKKWRDVERSSGYIPWLHRSHNGDSRFDVRWLIKHAGFPKFRPHAPPEDAWYDVPPLFLYSLQPNQANHQLRSRRGVA